MTKGEEARERVLARIEALFRTGFPNVRGRVSRLENGPPVGYPIKLRVSGPDPAKLPAIVDKVQDVLRKDPAIRDVNSDLGERLQTDATGRRPGQGARARRDRRKQIADTTQNSLSGHGHRRSIAKATS